MSTSSLGLWNHASAPERLLVRASWRNSSAWSRVGNGWKALLGPVSFWLRQ